MPYFKELRIMTYLKILVELEVMSLLIEKQEKDEDVNVAWYFLLFVKLGIDNGG